MWSMVQGVASKEGSGESREAKVSIQALMKRASERLERAKAEQRISRSSLTRLSDSGVIRDSLGLPMIDPNEEMRPYIARGYGFDHGELHRVLYYDPVVMGAFTFIAMEAIRAVYDLEELEDMTEEEEQLVGLLRHAYGLSGYTSTIKGGMEDLVFHAIHKVIYGFSLVESVFGVVSHWDMDPPEPKPMPEDPLERVVPASNIPDGAVVVNDGSGGAEGGKPEGDDGDFERRTSDVEMSDGTRKNPPKSIASAEAEAAAGGKKPAVGVAAPPAMVKVRLKEKPRPKPKKTYPALLPTGAYWIAPWSVSRWVWLDGEPVGILQYHPLRSNDGSTNLDGAGTDSGESGATKPGTKHGIPGAKSSSAVGGGDLELNGDYTYIPLSKCLLFQHLAVDGNPEGRGMRAPYPWIVAKLDTLARDQAAMDMGYNGIVTVKETGDNGVPHRTLSAEDGIQMGRALDAYQERRTNRIVVPYGLEVETEWPGFDVPDHVELYKYFDHQILISVMSGLLGLDASAAVSKGLSEGLAAIAYHMIESIVDEICRVIDGNGRAYTGLSRRIAEANIPGYSGRIPKYRASSIRYQDLDLMTKIMSRAAQFLLYTPGVEDEVEFRRAGRLRNISVEQIKRLREQVAARNGQSIQSSQSLQNQPVKPGEGTQTGDPDRVQSAKESGDKKPSPTPKES